MPENAVNRVCLSYDGTRLDAIFFFAARSGLLQAALTEMRFPGMLCVGMPVTVGLVFRWIGSLTDRPMLGAEVRVGVEYLFPVLAAREGGNEGGGGWERGEGSGWYCRCDVVHGGRARGGI